MVAAADGASLDYVGIDADIRVIVLRCRAQDPESVGRSPCAKVIMTQRGQGPLTRRRTSSPIEMVRPIQSLSTKPCSSGPVATTMFGRNRRTSRRPSG